jgi:LysM repeat protein/GH24 family phage-related lysozyme (muramidase)
MDSIEYRVQSGDTLSAIARRHQVTEAVLARLNGISDVNHIWAGQVLRIPRTSLLARPPAQARTHTVRAGETLSGIALHHHLTVDALAHANGIRNLDHIAIGQVLKLPVADSLPKARPSSARPRRAAVPGAPPQKSQAATSPARTPSGMARSAEALARTAPPEVYQQIERREGALKKHPQVYIDTEGHATAGMGHKLTAHERARYRVGATVPEPVLKTWAQTDIQVAYAAAVQQATRAKACHQGLVNALTCVNFQLGPAWYQEHTKTWAYIQAHQWTEAAAEAADSRWYRQTPVRVQDFQDALRALAGTALPPPAREGAPQLPQAAPLQTLVRNVHEALDRTFTDEEAVYANLAKLNHDPALIRSFKNLYKSTYHVEVEEHLKAQLSNTWLFGDERDRALGYLKEAGPPAAKGAKAPASTQRPTHKPVQAEGSAASGHAATLKKLGQQARRRLDLPNQGKCARGVSEMLGLVGYRYAGARPTVLSGIVGGKVFDHSTQRWIAATDLCVWVSSHSVLEGGRLKKGHKVKTEHASACAKFMGHTLRLFKFLDCTGLLRGNGWRKAAPEASIKALHALPEGAVIIFGPSLSRSMQRDASHTYAVGGHRHAGHIGILVHQGNEALIVADGLTDRAGQKYTAEFCLQSYEWAMGFVPTTEPMQLTSKDLPAHPL